MSVIMGESTISRYNISLVSHTTHSCSVCHQSFPLRKTMLRHMRSVHSTTKNFSCSFCERVFSRKDTLERHVLEQHSIIDRMIACQSCGRKVSTRAFKDHLDSQVCKASRAVISSGRFDMLGHLLPNEDEDCFLLAMRVLRTWKDEDLDVCQSSEIVSASNEPRERVILEARTLRRFNTTMSSAANRSGSLKSYCTALVLCLISFARCCSKTSRGNGLTQWPMHMEGAHHLLVDYHYANCSCSSIIDCSSLQELLRQDPALKILFRTIDSGGFATLHLGVLAVLSKLIREIWTYKNFGNLREFVYD
jgi:hypothetical protein